MEITDEDITIATQALFNFLNGRDKCSREILYRLPESIVAVLEQLEISEISDILQYACFPENEESNLLQQPSDKELLLYG